MLTRLLFLFAGINILKNGNQFEIVNILVHHEGIFYAWSEFTSRRAFKSFLTKTPLPLVKRVTIQYRIAKNTVVQLDISNSASSPDRWRVKYRDHNAFVFKAGSREFMSTLESRLQEELAG